MIARPREAPRDGTLDRRLAAITCHFNPCGYRSQRENYFRFAEELSRSGVPLFTAELVFGDAPFEFDSLPNVWRYRSHDVLWHKERLLNLLLTHVPQEFDKIAWLDADLLFENRNWPAETARLLEEFPVAQLFGEAVFLDRDGQPAGVRTGVARAAAEDRESAKNLGRAHPGFAWAARRSLLEQHGLFELAIAGGGDSLMVCAMFGWWNHPLLLRHGPPIRDALSRWGQGFWNDVQGRVGHVPGRILHLWHGERANRRYVERIDWLNRADFDPEVDLRLGANGLWEWADADPWLRDRLRQYFFDRHEDG